MTASKFSGMLLGLLIFVATACQTAPQTPGRREFIQYKCSTCHDVTGTSSGTGPTLKGLAGKTVQLEDGRSVVADDDYLRRSILEPDAEIVKGYSRGLMIAITGPEQSDLSKPEVMDKLMSYIKSLN